NAAFGLKDLDATFTNSDGSAATQAGSHPFAQAVTVAVNTKSSPDGELPDDNLRDLTVSLPPGIVGDPLAVPRCSAADFVMEVCPLASQVGIADVTATGPDQVFHVGLYSLNPPSGVAMRLGFHVVRVAVVVDVRINPNPPYNVLATTHNTANAVPLYGAVVRLWGVPGDPAHQPGCGGTEVGACDRDLVKRPFLTLPRACTGPLTTSFEALSWEQPDAPPVTGAVVSHDDATPPNPLGITGCSNLAFGPTISAVPTTRAASSPTGIDFSLNIKDEGLTNPDGLAVSDIRKAVVTLPEGMTVNPSSADGLEVCSEADLDRETLAAVPGVGCPEASKLGTIEVQTPLLDESLNGSLFLAEPYKNPVGSLIALYVVIKNKNLGIIVKQTAKVEPDPRTGRLVTTVDEIPQLPFSSFKLHFREGARSPLASPSACGSYDVEAELTPWAGGSPVTATSSFQLISGPSGGPCPPGGLPPFRPGLTAGALNNAAGAFSPFNLRLFRSDSEQELTRFSIKLPPGIAGILAGIPKCSDAAIEAAKSRTGTEELVAPSCPAASQIGRSLAGAGVGTSLTYV
ncbi:MAG: hypothetical protein ACRDHY_19650, partial [Anaerolineales bacterium]